MTLEDLAAQLADPSWRVRKRACATAVARVEAEEAGLAPLEDVLLSALSQSEDVGLRNAALEVLGRLGERALESLVRAYDEVSKGARKFILDALGEGGDPRALPTLLRALDDVDANTRAAAMAALSRIGGPEAEQALSARLVGASSFEAMAALDGLERMGARIPYESLAPLLADGLLRRGALPLLGRCGDPRAAEALGAALGARSLHLAGASACALGELMDTDEESERAVAEVARALDRDARAGLLRLLELEDAGVCACAARVAILAREDQALAAVSRLAADGLMDADALAPLRDWGAPCARRLLELSEHEHGRVAGVALELAAELTEDEATRAQLRATLRRALASEDIPRATAAARGLSTWAQDEDAPRLVEAARRGDEVLARACAISLAHLAERSAEAVMQALDGLSLEGSFGAAIARVACRLPSGFARTLLASGVNATYPRARRAAVEALGALDDGAPSSEISFALMDEDRSVQTAAARSMGGQITTGPDDETLELSAALASPDPGVRAAAAAGIRDHADQASLALLGDLTEDENTSVAVEALLALGRLEAPELAQRARSCSKHPDPERRKAALHALASVRSEKRTEDRAAPQASRARRRGPRHSSAIAGPRQRRARPRAASEPTGAFLDRTRTKADTSELIELATSGLRDDAWDVRLTAANVLAELGGAAAYEALEQRLEEESDDTVRAELLRLTGAGRDGGSPAG